MLSFLCCFPNRNKEDKKWKEIEEAAENLDQKPSWDAPDNTLMMQAFEWHVPDDQNHWRRLRKALPSLKDIGVDNMWIPPGCKAMSPSGNGYDIYDLYDLGEFDQKGSRATKWGTREQLEDLVSFARDLGIGIYWDAVLNHKAAADYTERFPAVKVDPGQRNVETSCPEEIEGWVGWDFPGRGDKYSSMKYHWYHFSGLDWDDSRKEKAIYKIVGPDKGWAKDVSDENGNYDFLMFSDLDYSNREVREDVLKWGQWISTEMSLSGMRLDAVKHYSAGFQKKFIDHLRETVGSDFFIVGEYWKGEVNILLNYLEEMDHRLSLFDAPLVGRFSSISRTDRADLRHVLDGTLVQTEPKYAVTFVANHDTQPGQSLEAPVSAFFKPLAYALILLRSQGQPCIFYGDLYGIKGDANHTMPPSCGGKLPTLARARKLYAYGEQRDYFDRRNCIGFVRYGNRRHRDGLACVMSNAGASHKRMYVGRNHAGEQWTDILEWRKETITIDNRGYADFPVASMSVSVWVNAAAEGRASLGRHFNKYIYKYN
ncbi:hypothetical protein ASPWEDRAFT_171758 [Aspergillus wentii DTO 134E9]|uniref:Glycosyl hydrolase family 13 catalytic domain-containing protein n=1 Tax=Aspergillus wentii DTO 134E9 TaxID=1073089 RepID=A0A1L9RJ11_ASPWE|nr:uncharacterized protein ASPWEDRAFT_171758 [Aspergillus wentii DTO 134E9]KAI9932117.1 hypothetical protein MW887_009626 [Aspergillus wentii]OJJ34926.1 hypothetical protein ASPWEDRAFT_171758 [Aspergillus wentii DTO 134E9]